LDGLEVVALFMDGVVVAQQTVIVALAIMREGDKVPLGLRLGSTENAVVCTELLQDLLARGPGGYDGALPRQSLLHMLQQQRKVDLGGSEFGRALGKFDTQGRPVKGH
jgi:hypothetical protein